MQVAAGIVGGHGRVVGVDLAAIDPPLENANAISFLGDVSDPSISQRILETLGGPADVLLSDAAPKLTGIRATDRAREEALLEAIEARIPELLAPGGTLLVKLLDCPEANAFAKRVLTVEAAFVVGWVVWFASVVAAVLYALGFASYAILAIETRVRAAFETSQTVKPEASRKGSAERYLLARGWSGPAGRT